MPNNFIQLQILKSLLTNPAAKFSELNPGKVETDLLTFHIKKLISTKLIAKEANKYHLTTKGVDIAGRIDLSTSLPVEQPKVGVSLYVFKVSKGRITHILLGKRLKEPSIYQIGGFTEKVRLGESLKQTAERCLKEETGLTTNKFQNIGFTRHVVKKNNDVEQDVVLLAFKIINPKGTLLTKTYSSENKWFEISQISKIENKFSNLEKDLKLIFKRKTLSEERILNDI